MKATLWPLWGAPWPGRGWSVLCDARDSAQLSTVRKPRKGMIMQLICPPVCRDRAAPKALLEAQALCSDRRLHGTVRAVAALSDSTFEPVFIEQSPALGSSPWRFVDRPGPKQGLRRAIAHHIPSNQQEDIHDLG